MSADPAGGGILGSGGDDMTTVREAFFDVCRHAGMTTWFGNPGSTELRMLRDWPSDFRYVLALQEASAVGVAAGYAIGAGRAQLAGLHSAGGVGHALGAVFNAYRDRVPLVVALWTAARQDVPLTVVVLNNAK